ILILFLKLQHYTLTFLHLVLFSLHIFTFPTFPSFPFSYIFLPFFTPFPILLHTFLSPLLFLYAFLSYFLTFPTHCLAMPQLILLYLVISYYHFNCKHCIMPSYCALRTSEMCDRLCQNVK